MEFQRTLAESADHHPMVRKQMAFQEMMNQKVAADTIRIRGSETRVSPLQLKSPPIGSPVVQRVVGPVPAGDFRPNLEWARWFAAMTPAELNVQLAGKGLAINSPAIAHMNTILIRSGSNPITDALPHAQPEQGVVIGSKAAAPSPVAAAADSKMHSSSSMGKGTYAQMPEDSDGRRAYEEGIAEAYRNSHSRPGAVEAEIRRLVGVGKIEREDPLQVLGAYAQNPLVKDLLTRVGGRVFVTSIRQAGTQSNPHSGFINIHGGIASQQEAAMALIQEMSNVAALGEIQVLDLAAMGVGTKGTGPISRARYIELAEEIEYRGVIRQLQILGPAAFNMPRFSHLKGIGAQLLRESPERRLGSQVSEVFGAYLRLIPDVHKEGQGKRYDALVAYRKQLDSKHAAAKK
ncbi:MAG: hypothetical protein H6581_00165 [Bacteroidia bacterium]|nr:hypothetical protein [Bacteroidia bacterium]